MPQRVKKKPEVRDSGDFDAAGNRMPIVGSDRFLEDQDIEFVEKIVRLTRDFNARTKQAETEYDEKAFVDGLYEV